MSKAVQYQVGGETITAVIDAKNIPEEKVEKAVGNILTIAKHQSLHLNNFSIESEIRYLAALRDIDSAFSKHQLLQDDFGVVVYIVSPDKSYTDLSSWIYRNKLALEDEISKKQGGRFVYNIEK